MLGSWWKLAVALAAGVFLGLGGLQLFYVLAQPLALLILAVSIAAATAPLVSRLETRVPRNLAILAVYFGILLVFVIIGQLTIPTLVSQARVIGTRGPDLMAEAQSRLVEIGVSGAVLGNLAPQLGQFSSMFVSLPLMIFSSVLQIFLILVMSIYWLIIGRRLRTFFLSLFPENASDELASAMTDIATAMGGYIRATIINSLVIGSLTAIGLSVIGVQFPLVLGLLAGLFEFIPILGPVLSGIMVVFVALLSSPTTAVIAFIYMFLLQQLEGNILVPNVKRRQTDISALLVILALVAGDTIGGLLGALIAIPVASAIQVIFVRLLVPAIRREIDSDQKEPVR